VFKWLDAISNNISKNLIDKKFIGKDDIDMTETVEMEESMKKEKEVK
jgi:hypothetical protein